MRERLHIVWFTESDLRSFVSAEAGGDLSRPLFASVVSFALHVWGLELVPHLPGQ